MVGLPRRTSSAASLAATAAPRHVGVELRRLAPVGQAVVADHAHAPVADPAGIGQSGRMPRIGCGGIAPRHQQQQLSRAW